MVSAGSCWAMPVTVAHDLRPEGMRRSAADGHQPAWYLARPGERLEHVACTVGGAFDVAPGRGARGRDAASGRL